MVDSDRELAKWYRAIGVLNLQELALEEQLCIYAHAGAVSLHSSTLNMHGVCGSLFPAAPVLMHIESGTAPATS